MPELKLFHSPTCPYCRKVIQYIETKSFTVTLVNRDESSQTRQELVELGGKTQVPCLIIDGQALYESDAIIQWLDEHKDEL